MQPLYKSTIKAIIKKCNYSGVSWKTTNTIHQGIRHLKKRQRRKEIPDDWSLTDYNTHILHIMNNIDNDVHLYFITRFTQNYFVFDDGTWIIIIGEDSIMETAMIGNPNNYFTNNPGYIYLGKVKDVLE